MSNPVITEHIVLTILFMDSLLNHCAENLNSTFRISKLQGKIKLYRSEENNVHTVRKKTACAMKKREQTVL